MGPRSGSFEEVRLLFGEETRVCEWGREDPECGGKLWLGWGECTEADWKRQVVLNDLKSGVEEDATSCQESIAPLSWGRLYSKEMIRYLNGFVGSACDLADIALTEGQEANRQFSLHHTSQCLWGSEPTQSWGGWGRLAQYPSISAERDKGRIRCDICNYVIEFARSIPIEVRSSVIDK